MTTLAASTKFYPIVQAIEYSQLIIKGIVVVIKDQIQLHIGFNPVVMNQDTTAATRAFFSMMHISQYREDFFISKKIFLII